MFTLFRASVQTVCCKLTKVNLPVTFWRGYESVGYGRVMRLNIAEQVSLLETIFVTQRVSLKLVYLENCRHILRAEMTTGLDGRDGRLNVSKLQ